jgi:hypothetical protein
MGPTVTTRIRAVTRTAFVALAVTACGNGGDGVSTPESTTSAGTETTIDTTSIDLGSVCPATVVVQTDWYPQAEHGGIYELLGDDYRVDPKRGSTRGSLAVRGTPTGVDLEIRAGGPFLESPVVTEMFLDDAITLGYVGTDVALARYAETPTLAVFNALSVNPQVILWNAELHPTARTIADIAGEVDAISVFGDRPFMRYFVAEGLVPQSKVDGNYKGSLLLATDDVAHQGFVTSEPYRYETLESGPVQVAWELIHAAGWTSYPQNLAINQLRLEELRPCLERLVPLMQQAKVDFVESPDRTVATILDVVERLATSWSQSRELADYAVRVMLDEGIVANGETTTFGDFESPRIDDFISLALPILREQGLEIPAVTKDDVATNEFLDATITLP